MDVSGQTIQLNTGAGSIQAQLIQSTGVNGQQTIQVLSCF